MAEIRRSDALGNVEQKSIKGYISKTIRVCTTCQRDNFYVKLQLPDSTVLECPRCDQVLTVPKGTENLP